VEDAQNWIEEEGESFTQACYVDSVAIGGNDLADDLIIVKINGFPVVEEEILG
jgi:hypothetical protein